MFACRRLGARLAFVRGSRLATGRVVALRDERDGQEVQVFRYPRVRFPTDIGREVTFESGMARSGDGWRVGDVVSVRYRPDHPESAEVATFAALWGVPLVSAVLAAVFLSVGVSIWLELIAL